MWMNAFIDSVDPIPYEALLGVLGIRDSWANYLRDKG